MVRKRKKKLLLKVLVMLLSLMMTTAGFSASAGAARIIPNGTVSIIKDGKVVGQFSQEAPLPKGTVLRCEGKCAVKLHDTYMVVDAGTEFSVTPAAGSTGLYVKTGTVYYVIDESSRPLQIDTPNGEGTTGDLAMTDKELKGYVRVSGNETEMGVIGGGTMMMDTAFGEMTIPPGHSITITAMTGGTPGVPEGATSGLTRNQKIAIGVGTAAVLTAGGIALASSSGGGGGGAGSPSSP